MILNDILARSTGQPIDELDADRDFIMDAAQAVVYGMIDRVITRRDLPAGAPVNGRLADGTNGNGRQ